MASRGMGDAFRSRAEARREDWLPDGVLSGFAATFAMTVVLAAAYALSRALGERDGTTLQQWLWALGHNPVTETTTDAVTLAIGLNLLMGLGLGLLYGAVVEPALGGPGWRKGMLFALVPFVLSVVAFLPIMGGGFLGAGIDAGPLPVLGNLVLHLVYGAVLGGVYGIALEAGLDGSAADRTAALRAERGGAVGVLVGVAVGFFGGLAIAPSLDDYLAQSVVVLAGALVGGASGLAAGSLLGMGGGNDGGRRVSGAR